MQAVLAVLLVAALLVVLAVALLSVLLVGLPSALPSAPLSRVGRPCWYPSCVGSASFVLAEVIRASSCDTTDEATVFAFVCSRAVCSCAVCRGGGGLMADMSAGLPIRPSRALLSMIPDVEVRYNTAQYV